MAAPSEPSTPRWHSMAPAEVARVLGVDPAQGLAAPEARERLQRLGPNALPEAPPPTILALALRQVLNFVVLLLLAGAALSLVVGRVGDAIAIFAALALNGVVGFLMDFRAEKSFASLKELVAPTARVRRDGAQAQLRASDLVPGDVVVLEAGDRVPADGRLVEGEAQSQESLLTGESMPSAKRPEALDREAPPLAERANELFAGTTVAAGRGVMIVTSTGGATEVGRIGRLLAETSSPSSPLTRRIDRLGQTVLWMVLALSGVLVVVGLFQGRPWALLVETAIALSIAAIPEGLPAVATLALAGGARRLAKSGVLLRKLAALEALGTVSTLALDKTGTLTANAMTVRSLRHSGRALEVSGEGWDPAGGLLEQGRAAEVDPQTRALLHAALACNDATLERSESEGWHVHGDPTEAALAVAAAKAGVPDPRGAEAREFSAPPGPGNPWMRVVCREAGGLVAYAKGAPEHVLERCALGDEERRAALVEDRALASRALRVLAVARRRLPEGWTAQQLESGWEWLGLVAMADPPRAGVLAVLAEARRAGLRLVMITGDQRATAEAIARELRLSGERSPMVVTGDEDPTAEADVYARATPGGKLRLVEALERSGQAVVMTGDGVNDAPALRAATVGIAMGRGADVAKEAADAVLTDERLETLLAGVREGRTVFLNIQRAVDFLLTCSVAEQLVVLLVTAAGLPIPLLPLQLLYLNLLTHTFPALGLTLEPAHPEVMRRPPIPREANLLPAARVATLLWHGLLITGATVAVGAWGVAHGGEAHARTLAFATIASSLLLHALTDRSPAPFGGWRFGGNPALFLFMAAAFVLQLAAIYFPPLARVLEMTPIDGSDWLGVAVASIASLVASELTKGALQREAGAAEAAPALPRRPARR